MSDNVSLPTGATVVVDTKVFFAVGGPSNPKYRQFRSAVRTAEASCHLPQRVVEELGGPETDRIKTALSEGWVTVADPLDRTDGGVVAATNDVPARVGVERAVTVGDCGDAVDVCGVTAVIGDDADDPIRVLRATGPVSLRSSDSHARTGLSTAVGSQLSRTDSSA